MYISQLPMSKWYIYEQSQKIVSVIRPRFCQNAEKGHTCGTNFFW